MRFHNTVTFVHHIFCQKKIALYRHNILNIYINIKFLLLLKKKSFVKQLVSKIQQKQWIFLSLCLKNFSFLFYHNKMLSENLFPMSFTSLKNHEN